MRQRPAGRSARSRPMDRGCSMAGRAPWPTARTQTSSSFSPRPTPGRPKTSGTPHSSSPATPQASAEIRPDPKLGLHGAHSGTVHFERCRLPATAIVGGEGGGAEIERSSLEGCRIGAAAQAIGIARAALEASVRYAKERKTFGVPIAQHQAIQFMVADMATELDAARLLLFRAASRRDSHLPHATESAQAKLFASEVAARVAHKAIQVHGGYGYSTEFPLERLYRDARVTEAHAGTGEIQRIVIAADLLAG